MAAAQAQKFFYATGRRKTSAARVFLRPGNGKVSINGKTIDGYLSRPTSRMEITRPFSIISQNGKFDVFVTVKGGGESGQAGAIRHGIARALIKFDEDMRPSLKRAKMLTRDARVKERKKVGLKRARKAPQYTKR